MSSVIVDLFIKATGETLYMSLVSALISSAVGIPLGVILYATKPGNFLQNSYVYWSLGSIVNIGRSIPFIILVVAIIPITRFVVGTFIGNTAMIFPLSISAIPFIARMIEANLTEVPRGLIEAAQSMGAKPLQIIRKVLLAEAVSGIIQSITIATIAIIGYSAMAGAVGAGGLGQVGIAYGYQRFNTEIMLYTVIILIVLVHLVQTIGDWLARFFDHRK